MRCLTEERRQGTEHSLPKEITYEEMERERQEEMARYKRRLLIAEAAGTGALALILSIAANIII